MYVQTIETDDPNISGIQTSATTVPNVGRKADLSTVVEPSKIIQHKGPDIIPPKNKSENDIQSTTGPSKRFDSCAQTSVEWQNRGSFHRIFDADRNKDALIALVTNNASVCKAVLDNTRKQIDMMQKVCEDALAVVKIQIESNAKIQSDLIETHKSVIDTFAASSL